MNEKEIIKYLEHKKLLKNPSPGRFKKEAKEFLLLWAKTKKIYSVELKMLFYIYSNNIFNVPLCEFHNCNNQSRFLSFSKGFSKGCCHDHATRISNLEKYNVEKPFQSKNIQKKVKQTFKEKYGNEIPFKTENYKNKMLEKYGAETPMHSVELVEKLKKNMNEKYGGMGNASSVIFEKQKQTNLNRYGIESIFKSKEKQKEFLKIRKKKYTKGNEGQKEIYEKVKKTNLKRYGFENPFSDKEIQNKIKKTCLEKYGVEYHIQSEEIKEKTKNTNLKKYGVDNPLSSKKIQNKVKQTCLEKYGVENNKMKHITNLVQYNDKIFIRDMFIKNKIFNVKKFCNYFNVTASAAYNKLRQLEIDFNHNYTTSILEKEIYEFVKTFPFTIEDNNTSILDGKELDIYIPNKNIAIEFNGLYWHSELKGKDNTYHLDKTERCEQQGINLIHIFENEWLEKQNIVKSLINSTINESNTQVNHIVKEISPQETYMFLKNNYIFEFEKTIINLGLFTNNTIKAIMSFEEYKKNKYILKNFCVKINHEINFFHFNLCSFFVKKFNPEKIIFFDNRRYSQKKIFINFGFKKTNITIPTYWYFGKKIKGIEHADNWNKDILKNKIEIFNPLLSEWENMKLNGYNRIWDCGQNILEWKRK